MNLELVRSRADVKGTLETFNHEAKRDPGTVRALLRQTSFWVYDLASTSFVPSKFAGFRGMTVRDYAIAKVNGRKSRGATFNGHLTRLAIADALGDSYKPDPQLAAALVNWAEELLATPNVFEGIKRAKWVFIKL